MALSRAYTPLPHRTYTPLTVSPHFAHHVPLNQITSQLAFDLNDNRIPAIAINDTLLEESKLHKSYANYNWYDHNQFINRFNIISNSPTPPFDLQTHDPLVVSDGLRFALINLITLISLLNLIT